MKQPFLAGLIVMLCAGSARGAQSAAELLEKAPPAVDEALRARISGFFQAHVDGKFRLADQYVAEDSKEFFFAANKTRWQGFEIVRINYSDNFTKAKAVVACRTFMYMRGEKLPSTMPLTTSWKVENGDWYWYVPPQAEYETPFGTMHGTDSGASGQPQQPVIPIPKDLAGAAKQIVARVRLERSEVMLSDRGASSAAVQILNGMPGPVRVSLPGFKGAPGFSAKLDREEIPANGSASLAIRYEPRAKEPHPGEQVIRIAVEPTGQVLELTARFSSSVPPEAAPAPAPAPSKPSRKRR